MVNHKVHKVFLLFYVMESTDFDKNGNKNNLKFNFDFQQSL
jgi:hypothetical protein